MTYREFEDTPVDAEFKQKINVEFLVLKQIDRCNQAALEGDEIKFSNACESLLAMLPKENRLRIENDKTKDQYTSKIEQPVYKYSCGKPMGTLENPIFRNKPTDWNYDGGEPIRISPMVEEVIQTDYQKLYKIILNELQDVGVTWKIEPRGNVDKKIDPPPMPLLKLKNGTFVRVLIEKGIEGVKDGIVKDEEQKPETEPKPESEPSPDGEEDSDEEANDEDGDSEETEPVREDNKLSEESEEETEADGSDELEITEKEEDSDLEAYKAKKELEREKIKLQKIERERFRKETKPQKITEQEIKNIADNDPYKDITGIIIDNTLPEIKVPKITKRRRKIPRSG